MRNEFCGRPPMFVGRCSHGCSRSRVLRVTRCPLKPQAARCKRVADPPGAFFRVVNKAPHGEPSPSHRGTVASRRPFTNRFARSIESGHRVEFVHETIVVGFRISGSRQPATRTTVRTIVSSEARPILFGPPRYPDAPMRRCLALTNTLPVPLSGHHLDSSHLPAQPNNHTSTRRRYSGGGRNAGDQPILRLQRHRCRPAHSGSNQPGCPVSCRAALSITFSDGLVRELDFATVLPGVLASIDDDESFAAVVVAPITGAFAWPNDIGPDPDGLHGEQESAAATQPQLLREYRPADSRDQRNTSGGNRSGRLSLWSGSRPRWPVSPPLRECPCLLEILVACS